MEEIAIQPDRESDDREYVASLARGLSVIRAFDREHPAMTLTQVAARTGLTRATARRFLLTLCSLGYANNSGKEFCLTPRVLELGFTYLASLRLPEIAQPFLHQVSDAAGESCSLCILDGQEIVYAASVPTKRILSAGQMIGTRRPAYPTSMGRVLLAALPDAALDQFFATTSLKPLTGHTITDPNQLRKAIHAAQRNRYALVDQELEEGLRSIAVPVQSRSGQVLAALTVCGHSGRLSTADLKDSILPLLRNAAAGLEAALPLT